MSEPRASRATLSRRAFLYLSALTAGATSLVRNAFADAGESASAGAAEWETLLARINRFPLTAALFGRRSRRFGWGMEIPSGPLAYRSELPPTPLDDFERSFLIATGLGVSGWHSGIPYSASQDGLCTYAARYTGRTFPSAAGIGGTDMFYTEDDGTYFVTTRDAVTEGNWGKGRLGDSARLIATVKSHTRQLSAKRVELPREGPHYSEHNLWNANVPGSTVFIPVANVSEQMLGFLFIVANSGYTVWDDLHGRAAGDLDAFHQSGLLNRDKKYPLSYMEQYLLTTCAVEMGAMGHNIALGLQALGLGGWFFSGISPFSLMGVAAAKGIDGLGFRFEKRADWGVPNPVGLDGVYEGYCPPFYPDMRSAVMAYVQLKHGAGGAYTQGTEGPFLRNDDVKATAVPPTAEIIDCVVATAEYIHSTFGKFPGTVPTIFLRYYTQAHRLETGFYDRFFREGMYLDTHLDNVKRWLARVGREA